MKTSRGYGIIELLIVLGFIGVFMGIAISNLKELNDPLLNGSSELMGFFKQVRARAFATTSAYVIEPISTQQITTRFAKRCSDPVGDFTADTALSLTLPTGVQMADSAWSICFSARGLPDSNVTITLVDNDYKVRQIEIMLGGAVRLL